ncbi:hypothetical protein Hamer_G013179, partial [Homarus americanus]
LVNGRSGDHDLPPHDDSDVTLTLVEAGVWNNECRSLIGTLGVLRCLVAMWDFIVTPMVGLLQEGRLRRKLLKYSSRKAVEDRVKEQEAATAERARLEEILTLCAEYERQHQTGTPSPRPHLSPHYTLTQNSYEVGEACGEPLMSRQLDVLLQPSGGLGYHYYHYHTPRGPPLPYTHTHTHTLATTTNLMPSRLSAFSNNLECQPSVITSSVSPQ